MKKTFLSKHQQGSLLGSWRTSLCGFAALLWGLWLAHVLWVHGQSLYFNLVYALTGPVLFLVIGVGLLHARDHKHK